MLYLVMLQNLKGLPFLHKKRDPGRACSKVRSCILRFICHSSPYLQMQIRTAVIRSLDSLSGFKPKLLPYQLMYECRVDPPIPLIRVLPVLIAEVQALFERLDEGVLDLALMLSSVLADDTCYLLYRYRCHSHHPIPAEHDPGQIP